MKNPKLKRDLTSGKIDAINVNRKYKDTDRETKKKNCKVITYHTAITMFTRVDFLDLNGGFNNKEVGYKLAHKCSLKTFYFLIININIVLRLKKTL